MSQAYFASNSKLERQMTKEGLDLPLSLPYYSRMRFVTHVLPLLTASPLPGRVVSIFGPGRNTKLILDDLSLSKPQNFNFTTLSSHAAFMTTFFFEKIAASNPGKISLAHYFPMLVITPAFKGDGVPGWFKGSIQYSTLYSSFSVSTQGNVVIVCSFTRHLVFQPGRRMGKRIQPKAGVITIAMSSDGIRGGGASRVNWNEEEVPLRKGYKNLRKDEVRKKVWDYTMAAFQGISDDGHFFG